MAACTTRVKHIYVRRRFDTGTLGSFKGILHGASSNSEPKTFIYKYEDPIHSFPTFLRNSYPGRSLKK